MKKYEFITHMTAAAATGRTPSEARAWALELWELTREQGTGPEAGASGKKVSDEELECHVLATLVTAPISGGQIRSQIRARLKALGISVSTRRLCDAYRDLKQTGRIWTCPNNLKAAITDDGKAYLAQNKEYK